MGVATATTHERADERPVGSASIGHHLPLRGMVGPAGAVGSVGVAALGAVGALVDQPVAAVGPADDRPGPGGWLAGGRGVRCTARPSRWRPGGVLLLAADPLVQLRLRPWAGGEGARVERHERRVKGRGSRSPGALAGGSNGPLADGLGVAGWHARAVATEGLAQRGSGGAQLSGGGVDAAELFGELEGAFGLAAVRKKAAGLAAHPPLRRRQAPLGEGGGEDVAVDASWRAACRSPTWLASWWAASASSRF
jgi:hypothetical protein